MANERSSRVWMQILLVVLLLVPLLFLLVLPGGGWLTGGLWFWMILLLCIWMINDLSPITSGRRWLGYATFLVLILIPLPHAFWHTAGIYCPYL